MFVFSLSIIYQHIKILKMTNQQILLALIPFTSAAIAWFTNYIAIKMLFYPRIKRNFFLFSLQGVFPKRQKEMARKLGELFAEELGVQKTIQEKLNDVFADDSLVERIRGRVEELAHSFIGKELPFLSALVPPDLIKKLSGEVATTLGNNLKEEVSKGASDLSSKLDVKKLVQDQIEALKVESLEQIFQSLLKKEFKFIELSGAVLGFIIGCVQVGIMSLAYYTPN